MCASASIHREDGLDFFNPSAIHDNTFGGGSEMTSTGSLVKEATDGDASSSSSRDAMAWAQRRAAVALMESQSGGVRKTGGGDAGVVHQQLAPD